MPNMLKRRRLDDGSNSNLNGNRSGSIQRLLLERRVAELKEMERINEIQKSIFIAGPDFSKGRLERKQIKAKLLEEAQNEDLGAAG